jgi:hypothetical protein
MGSYNQLTEAQRYQIYALKKVRQDQQTIASVLGVSRSTVCREIRRNRGQRGYRAHQAHQKALSRRRDKAQATPAPGDNRPCGSAHWPRLEPGASGGSLAGGRGVKPWVSWTLF